MPYFHLGTGLFVDEKVDKFTIEIPNHMKKKVEHLPPDERTRRITRMIRGPAKTMEIFRRTKWRN